MKLVRVIFSSIFNLIRFILAVVIFFASISIFFVDVDIPFVSGELAELGVKLVIEMIGIAIARIIAPETDGEIEEREESRRNIITDPKFSYIPGNIFNTDD